MFIIALTEARCALIFLTIDLYDIWVKKTREWARDQIGTTIILLHEFLALEF
jgi:hypothetical protein